MTVQDSVDIIQDIADAYRRGEQEKRRVRELLAENDRLLREIELLREIKRLNEELAELRQEAGRL